MGQVLLQDNIPTPVVASTTTLTLAASNLGQPTSITIGGQAYTPSAIITLNTATTGANGLDTGALGAIQLWYIYAIVHNSTFVPALVASLAVPSTGPSMASGSALNGAYGTAYKLVGAFYTNGSSQVGSIVPITGPATTGWMSYTPTVVGVTSITTNVANWRRVGTGIQISGHFVATASGTVTQFRLALPAGLTFDAAQLTGAITGFMRLGSASFQAGPNTPYSVYASSSTTVSFITTTGGDINGNSFSAGDRLLYEHTAPITGWNPTLL